MRITDFTGQVAAVSGTEEFVGVVDTAGATDSDFDGDVVSDDALDAVVQPRDVTEQVVDMELWADGALVQRGDLMDQMTVDRDYDNVVQGWGCTNPLWTPDGVFGAPWACYGPGIGKKSITIKGLYDTPTGVHRINLLTDGVCDNAERQSGENGIFEVLEGGDGVARYDGVKVTKIFPPGHGLYRGRLFREIVRALGDDQMNFEDGNRMDIEVQLVDALPIPTMAEIAEVENRRILKDSEGYWINPRVGKVRSDESPVFYFEERDILRMATVQQKMPNNPITLVIAKGERQKTKEDCGDVWQVETQYFYQAPYTYRKSLYEQKTDGTYTSLEPNDPVDGPVLTKKIKTQRLYKCDVLVREIIETWELSRREVPRHVWADLGVMFIEDDDGWAPLSCYTDDNDGVGGGPAYGDVSEVFRLVSVSETIYFFAETGYELPLPTGGIPYHDWRAQIIEKSSAAAGELYSRSSTPMQFWTTYPRIGQAQGSVNFFHRFGHIEGAVMERGLGFPLTPWTERQPDVGRKIWGNGTGVNTLNSTIDLDFPMRGSLGGEYDDLMPWSATVTAFSGDGKNFLKEKVVHEWGWAAFDGRTYYYGENSTKASSSKSLVCVSSDKTTFSASGSSHSETVSENNNITGENSTQVTTGISGNLPPIDRLDSVTPNPDIYEDGEQEDLTKRAARTETETVVVTVPFDFLLSCHLPREVTVDFPWAENAAELQAMAEALASESAAQAVFFTLPANFLIREAMPIHLIYRPLDIDHDLRVKSVKWARSPEQPIVTQVEARLYPF